MAGPVLGPVIGGWLTQNYTWRYVFYINLPLGVLAFIGLSTFLPDARRRVSPKLDWVGFGSLSVAVGAFQIMLDRGEQLDWFSSGEIVVEGVLAAAGFYVFIIHTLTVPQSFVNPALFRNRNFTAGVSFVFVIGLTFFASLALQPPYLQNLMSYPVVTAGLVMGPRGIGTMAAMVLVGKMIGRIDTRLLLATGLGLSAWSFYSMTGWTPDVSQKTIVAVGIIQGVGLGFLFTPLSVVTLSTLSAELRTEGAGLYSLSRNLGSSIGISVVSTLLTRNTQINHAEIGSYVSPVNRMRFEPAIAQFFDPSSAAGRAALDSAVTEQARIIAYIDDYKLLMIAMLLVLPLLVVFTKPARAGSAEQSVVVE
jgi:DHA2 family multidrug resistance protein